jgi:hypothetical protein
MGCLSQTEDVNAAGGVGKSLGLSSVGIRKNDLGVRNSEYQVKVTLLDLQVKSRPGHEMKKSCIAD